MSPATLARASRLIAVLVCAAAAFAGAHAQAPTRGPAGAPSFVVGIGRSIHDPEGSAAAMSALGVQSMRLDAPWKSIEVGPGRYSIPAWLDTAVDSAKARGIEPLLILAYGHPLYGEDKPRTTAAIAAFTRYAVYVTKHFEGRVRYFDLWNEWDAHTGRTTPGNADDYVALARSVYPAMKAANPGAVVLSGGIASLGTAGWVERFIAIGGLEVVDGLSLHPYNFQQLGAGTPEKAIAELDRLHALTTAAGRPTPIYVTEMGYPAFDGRGGVTTETAAAYLARFMLLASTRDYIAGTWWYCLRDQGRDFRNKEHNFGVLDMALRPKPAGDALRSVAQLLAAVGRFRDDSGPGDDSPGDDGGAGAQRRISATRADGSAVVLAWRDDVADPQLLRDIAAAAAAAADGPAARERARR